MDCLFFYSELTRFLVCTASSRCPRSWVIRRNWVFLRILLTCEKLHIASLIGSSYLKYLRWHEYWPRSIYRSKIFSSYAIDEGFRFLLQLERMAWSRLSWCGNSTVTLDDNRERLLAVHGRLIYHCWVGKVVDWQSRIQHVSVPPSRGLKTDHCSVLQYDAPKTPFTTITGVSTSISELTWGQETRSPSSCYSALSKRMKSRMRPGHVASWKPCGCFRNSTTNPRARAERTMKRVVAKCCAMLVIIT